MGTMNRVFLLGNLVRDPELRTLQNGRQLGKWTIAVNDRYKKGEQWVEKVSFIDCECWGKTAETVQQYCCKGSPILIEGHLSQSVWKDQHGNTKSRLLVEVDRVQLVGRGPRPVTGSSHDPAGASDPASVPGADGPADEPF